MNKLNKPVEEDKPLPLNLVRKLIGNPQDNADDIEKGTERSKSSEVLETSQKKIERDVESVKPKSEKPKTEKTVSNKKEAEIVAEPPKQMNISISRRHFRNAQRLLTDAKLFADEKMNKSFSNGNLMELLIEIGKDLYDREPDKFEKRILEFLKR